MPTHSLGEPYDFDPVDFHWFTIGMGATSPQHEYQLFTNRNVSFKQPYFEHGKLALVFSKYNMSL
jgi:hypothetical protein